MSSVEDVTLLSRLQSMLELQDGINKKIRADWRTAGNPWYRAIWTECAELLDHIGWKWWKHQAVDLPQVHLELVDILHFGLSEMLQEHGTAQQAASQHSAVYLAYGHAPKSVPAAGAVTLQLVESFALCALGTKRFDLAGFCSLATSAGLHEEDIYQMYVGKNILNAFRQDHGYKTGEYRKVWHGREDNAWLAEFAAGLKKDPRTFASQLYEHLSEKYGEVVRGP